MYEVRPITRPINAAIPPAPTRQQAAIHDNAERAGVRAPAEARPA